jgi:hypothetical protein
MNKKIILSMGLPVVIRNAKGRLATIELNNNECVICRFHPNNSVYLSDAQLKKWYPVSPYKRVIYQFKKYRWLKKLRK